VDLSDCTKYYKNEASNYDKRRFSCDCAKFKDTLFKTTVSHFLSNDDNKPILDAGTGTGRFAIYFAEIGRTVIAMDFSMEMLNEARAKMQKNALENKIFLVRGDIQNLPFKSEVFSAVNSIHVLVHFPSVNGVIAEFSRVLENRGVFVTEVSNRLLSKAYYHVWKAIVGSEFSYRDYYRTLGEFKNITAKYHLHVANVKSIMKVPLRIIHLFTCILGYKSILRIMGKIEKFNFGTIRIIKIVKLGHR